MGRFRRNFNMKNIVKKALVLAVAGSLTCGLLTGCGEKKTDTIDGTKTLLTINDDTVSVGTAAVYARIQQAETYEYYSYLYSMYGYSMGELFDTVSDSETGETYGEMVKEQIVDELKNMVVLRQHAADYGVDLTDDEKAAIESAAAAFAENNGEEFMKKVGATKEDVVELLTLQTYKSKMLDPVVKDVDTNIDDAEAQQTSVSYVRVKIPEASEESESAAASAAESVTEVEPVAEAAAESAAASAAEAVSEVPAEESAVEAAGTAASSGAESVAEAAEQETKEAAETKEKTQKIIDLLLADENPAEVDLGDIAKQVDDSLYDTSGSFSTNDTSDTTLDDSIMTAIAGMTEDGSIVDYPVLSSDGSSYFVVRLNKYFDEEKTETKKASILANNRQEFFDTTVDEWLEASTVAEDDSEWEKFVINDTDVYTTMTRETEAESAAESLASAAESVAAASNTVESMAQVPESIAEPASVASPASVETAVSESSAGSVESAAVSSAESVVESAVSTAAK